MDELPVGTRIERYEVEARLGEGGMAAVYRVRHTTLGTTHALKVLTMGGKKLRARLVQEGRVQAMLDHPNVVAVRDVLDVHGAPGLLMDFVDGPDLEDWIRDHRPSPAVAEAIFRQVLAAVQAAHKAGVVHRDLKPANVLMKQLPSGGWQARVADFGLAKAVEEGKDSMALTRSGASMGTPSYMAPEQIRDASSVDHRADIWALGAIFHELLVHRKAFDGDDIVEVFNAVTQGSYTPAGEIRGDIPPHYDALVARCLQVDPDRRARSCDELLALLDGEDPPSAQSTWDGSMVPVATRPAATPAPPRRRTRLAWAIPLVMAAVLGVATVGTVAGIALVAKRLGGGACAGWVRGPLVFGKTEGSVWVVRGDREVVRALPSERTDWKPGKVRCTLPSGSKVTLLEDPVRLGRAGIWIRVTPSNVELPEPEPDEDAPEDKP